MKRAHSFLKGNQQGAVMVELALILPLLVLFILGILNFGLVLRENQILQNAAREGARFSALPANFIDPIMNPAATEAAIKERVVTYLQQEGIEVLDTMITVDQNHPIALGGLTVTGSQVTVSYSRSMLTGEGGLWPFGPIVLTGQSVFRNLY